VQTPPDIRSASRPAPDQGADAHPGSGAVELAALAQLAGGLAEELELRQELTAVERLGHVGRWCLGPEGCLVLSEEAARIFDGAADLVALGRMVEPALQSHLGQWFEAEAEHEELLDLSLHGADGAVRRVRLSRAAGQTHRGYVQALAYRPEVPEVAPDLLRLQVIRNLSTFTADLARGLARAERSRRPLSVLCLRVGDLAEQTADWPAAERRALCRAVVQRLERSVRDQDLSDIDDSRFDLAEQGGSEFLVAVEVERPSDAAAIARRLLTAAVDPIGVGLRRARFRLAVGIALSTHDGTEPGPLVEAACRAAAAVKGEGDRALAFASERLNREIVARLALEADLRQAVQERSFVVYYQPKVDVASERIVGMEALVRWQHPERGMVSPAEFIPVAEETGLIVPIGALVLRQACEDTVRWQREGHPPIRMAVNLSSAQFAQPDLVEMVLACLRETGLAPDCLELELTESMLMDDAEAAVTILRRLKRAGIHIAIDDFGTGYSSLSYLRRFPIDALKIDRSFIHEVNVNPDDAAIATSIILMGRSLKLRVVAEGVETKKQLAFLRVMQCDEAQGFLYSPPVPMDQARELLVRLSGGPRAA
jgi:EAL domain-containing protein (putative c-di-GMP-specific phosphodiesterase class I)/GGDEF domain-containing protein